MSETFGLDLESARWTKMGGWNGWRLMCDEIE